MTRTLFSRAGVGASARIVQQQPLELLRVAIDAPILILILHGSKTLRSHGREWLVHAGEAVAINGGQVVDIINHPPDYGAYQAEWLVWDGALLAEHAARAAAQPSLRELQLLRRVEPGFAQAFQQAFASIGEPELTPAAVARHRLAELLIWLDGHGVRFAPAQSDSLRGRVRQLLAGAPAEGWTAPQVARQMAMSEATLRRKLAAEDSSLSELLVDVRMSYALTLLQATERPITQIALDAGYESASRFAVRFRQRFGFAPTAIRGHRRG